MPERFDGPADDGPPGAHGPLPRRRPLPSRLLLFLDPEGPLNLTVFVVGCVIVALVVLYFAVSLKWIALG